MTAISQDRSRNRMAAAVVWGAALTILLALMAVLGVATVAFGDLPTVITLLSAAIVSLMAGVLATLRPRAWHIGKGVRRQLYTRRLEELTAARRRPSKEVDRVLDELAEVAAARQAAIDQLTSQLSNLSVQEKELRERNEHLANVSPPAVKVFAAINAEGERRSARRDYVLFVIGVVVTTVISIVFFWLQNS